MHILHFHQKRTHLDTLEKYCIYKEAATDNRHQTSTIIKCSKLFTTIMHETYLQPTTSKPTNIFSPPLSARPPPFLPPYIPCPVYPSHVLQTSVVQQPTSPLLQ